MAQFDVPLPEITKEDFERAWLRFEYIAAAKRWDEAKQLSVLPTLLRGPLIDFYVSLTAAQKADVKTLRDALAAKAGIEGPFGMCKVIHRKGSGPSGEGRPFRSRAAEAIRFGLPGRSADIVCAAPTIFDRTSTAD